jgi:hypothetical protein
MSERIQLALGALLALVFGLSRLARRFPHVAWLRPFRDAWPQVSEAQRERTGRRTAFLVGGQLILMGIALPFLYGAVTVAFFHDFTTKGVTLALAGSVLCIGLGVVAIWQSLRGRG